MHQRQEYMQNKISHEEYYGQFVDEFLRQLVANRFSKERLARVYQTDKHFNIIHLYEWDGMALWLDNKIFRASLKSAGDFYSVSSAVCTLKEAARQVATRE